MTCDDCVGLRQENNELRAQLERIRRDRDYLVSVAQLHVHDIWQITPRLPSYVQDTIYKLHDLVWPA